MLARGSNRVVDIDESAVQAGLFAQVRAQCLDAMALGGVMAGGEEMQAVFAGEMDGLLGGFTGDEAVNAGFQSRCDQGLRGAAAPGQAPPTGCGGCRWSRRICVSSSL